MRLPHGPVETPLFMPVATQGTLKGLTPEQLESVGCRLCLNNTYHLGLRPGQTVLDKIGGAHKLQSWSHNILTGEFVPAQLKLCWYRVFSPLSVSVAFIFYMCSD